MWLCSCSEVQQWRTSPIKRSHSPSVPRLLSQMRSKMERGHRRSRSLHVRNVSTAQAAFFTCLQVDLPMQFNAFLAGASS